MAKVQYTAIVNEIKGRLANQIFSHQKGTDYIAIRGSSQTNPNTLRQQKVRGHMAKLNTAWSSLTPTQQNLWQSFAKMSHSYKTGRGAFRGLNQKLLSADHPSLGCIDTPPITPGTPTFPTGFCVSAAGSCQMQITWSGPANASTFITAYFHLHDGFCCIFPTYGNCPTTGESSKPRFIGTCVSSAGTIYHNHAWPVGTLLFYYILAMDAYGRQTPKTHRLKLKVT
ncbi:MAG: hypothetical protein P8078_00155 [bacterium]